MNKLLLIDDEADIRRVLSMSLKQEAFVAAIISLAVKGLVEIEEQKKDFTLRRLPGEPKSPLTPGERAVLDALLPTPHASIEMDNKNHEDFQAARKALGKALKAEYRGRLFNLNGLYLLGPIVVSVLAIGAAAFLDGGPLVWIGYAVAVVVLHILFTFLMRQTIINVSRYIEYDLKNEVFDHYQLLSLNFYKSNRTGDLMNRISEDVTQVRMYAGPAIMYGIQTLTLFACLVPLMFIKAPTIAFYALVPLPVLSVLIYWISRVIHKRSTRVQAFLSDLSTFAQEGVISIDGRKIRILDLSKLERISELG